MTIGPYQDQGIAPKLYLTRLVCTDTGGRGPEPGHSMPTDFEPGCGLGDYLARFSWLNDTWDADYQYMGGTQRTTTNAKVYLKRLKITSAALFKSPYVSAAEAGQMEWTREQANRSENLLQGGFCYVDDFRGLRQWPQFERQDSRPQVRDVSDDTGRLIILMTRNFDWGDTWEWMDDAEYPSNFASDAYCPGMNSIIDRMTY